MWHAVAKRARMQQEMQAEHKVTSAVRAANRRAESQLLQARQVSNTKRDSRVNCQCQAKPEAISICDHGVKLSQA